MAETTRVLATKKRGSIVIMRSAAMEGPRVMDGRVGNIADHDHYFGLRFVFPGNELANNRRHYVVIDLAFEIDSKRYVGTHAAEMELSGFRYSA